MSRAFHAKSDSQTIAGWRTELNRILLVFNTELGLNIYVAVSDIRDGITKTHTALADTHSVISEVERNIVTTHTVVTDTHTMVSDIHHQMLRSQEAADHQHRSDQPSIPDELPPPAPRACFGRSELVGKIVDLVRNLTPIALIGSGGVGKTSIALTVLHHNHIKKRFGANRRFIRCDQFTASCAHLLSRLSKVIGAGVENPGDLASLRPFLSSREIFIVLDNAESILDPQGTDAQEIYAVVEELSRFDNICLCITSRISVIPSDCKTIDVPTLSIDAARDAFYRIYEDAERPDSVDNILDQLDFHPLAVTLLAVVAHQNKWDTDKLTREWERQRTGILQMIHDGSNAATIELSLASPTFQELGPNARAFLEVIAFFPQGINENNLSWLFPTILNRANISDKFCVLSLAYRSNSFITMLAPLRDHFHPKDPKSSQLLSIAKERYFTRMSAVTNPNMPDFGESRWIASEDVNVEHLLDVFTTIDGNSVRVWDACADFIRHLAYHKQRSTILGPRIEGLPDRHPAKPKCLFQFSRLSHSVGNLAERKRLLTVALTLWRKRGNDRAVARALSHLSDTNRLLDLHEEGMQLAEEASEIFKRLGDMSGQAQCLVDLARLLYAVNRLDAAEETAFHAIDLLSGRSEQHPVCELHGLLAKIYRSKGDREKASDHFEVARALASSFNWHQQLFPIHCDLARLFFDEGRFDDAQAHVERAKSHTLNHTLRVGHTMELQAELWYEQHRFGEARSEALRAIDVFEKLGATKSLNRCSEFVQRVEEEMNKPVILDESAGDEQVTESK